VKEESTLVWPNGAPTMLEEFTTGGRLFSIAKKKDYRSQIISIQRTVLALRILIIDDDIII